MTSQSRYQKQILFDGIGAAGQQRLGNRRVLLVGCGALGCVAADAMVRAGVGQLRIVDRDFVELSNLQRQVLYTEQDVADRIPKAIAAARRLQRVNSEVEILPTVEDVNDANILQHAAGTDLILDGTDNFETRYLVNDAALELNIPWIFTGCTGSHGQMMPVFPHRSACLRCLMQNPPPPGSTETCDTAGVLGPAISVIASLQAAVALKILSAAAETNADGDAAAPLTAGVELKLTTVDVWTGTFRQIDVSRLREQADCPACRHGERLWLQGRQSSDSTVLCGRNAVQVSPPEKLSLSLEELGQRLATAGTVTSNPFLVRVALRDSDLELTVFPDGRAIVKGTEDPAVSRSVYARYVGT
jgi:molybdopterin/thiamine biosynthesis adenylyltransferase